MDDERYVVVPARDEQAVEVSRSRWIERQQPFVALRVDTDQAAVEYDLTHLERWLSREAVHALDTYDGFHGRSYGMVRHLSLTEAEAVATRVAELATSPETTAAASARA